MGCVWGAWGCFLSFQGCFGGVGGCIRALRVIWECFLLNSHQYTWCTYKSTDIFQKTWGSQMSQISKCPKVTVVLTYWEASGDVSELRYKSLLCCSSKRSYCTTLAHVLRIWYIWCVWCVWYVWCAMCALLILVTVDVSWTQYFEHRWQWCFWSTLSCRS